MQQIGKPAGVGLAVLGEAEEVEDHGFKAGSGADFDPNESLPVARIPPIVPHAGRDVDLTARLGRSLLATEPEIHAAPQHREPLVHSRVPMLADHGAPGSDIEVDYAEGPGGFHRADAHDRSLTRHRVFDDVTSRSHLVAFSSRDASKAGSAA